MIFITETRPDDDLSEFGDMIKFAGLVYGEDEGVSSSFEPYNMDGDVVFVYSYDEALVLFDEWTEVLRNSENDFLDQGDEEAFVLLTKTARGYMILAASTLMGFDHPESVETLPNKILGMPHITMDRIEEEI